MNKSKVSVKPNSRGKKSPTTHSQTVTHKLKKMPTLGQAHLVFANAKTQR